MYGLIRQWSGSGAGGEGGGARDDRSGSGGGGACGWDAGDGSGGEGACGRRGAGRANGVLDQVRACLEVAGRVVPGSDDVVYLAGEVVRTEVRTDGPG